MATQTMPDEFSGEMPRQAVHPSKISNALVWVMQVLGALIFINSGVGKLMGAPMAVAMFDAIGVGHWFRYLTGFIELGSALLLLTPKLSGIGALLLMGVMAGAVLTEVFVLGRSPALPLSLFVMMTIIAYFRRNRTADIMSRSRTI